MNHWQAIGVIPNSDKARNVNKIALQQKCDELWITYIQEDTIKDLCTKINNM